MMTFYKHGVKSRERITLFLSDGEREEGDETGDRQHRENHADSDEELQTFEPRAPEILQVHDVCDETPERHDTCPHTHSFIQWITR